MGIDDSPQEDVKYEVSQEVLDSIFGAEDDDEFDEEDEEGLGLNVDD